MLARIVAAIAVCTAVVSSALAQTYPSKPVTIVIGYTPGAVSDLTARTIADGLQQAWGQTFIVDNRPGSGGNIGAALVARAPADGYTLMIGTDAQMASNVHLYKHVGFDPVKDFAPVAFAGANIICLAVNAELPIKSVADVIAYAKANPGKLTYGSAGVGTAHHLIGAKFNLEAGVDIVHVPYKGSAPAVTDLVSGQVQMMYDTVASALPHIKAGKLRPLAVATAKRSLSLQDIPTIAEAALPGFEVTTWFGALVPAKTPKEIVTKLNGEIVKILNMPDVKKRLIEAGAEPVGNSPEEMAAQIKNETETFAAVVKQAKITPD
jgi:tripartite-type tricarboxylate transporter receptor subunit TctC